MKKNFEILFPAFFLVGIVWFNTIIELISPSLSL